MTLSDFLKDIHEALRLNRPQTCAPTNHDQVVHWSFSTNWSGRVALVVCENILVL